MTVWHDQPSLTRRQARGSATGTHANGATDSRDHPAEGAEHDDALPGGTQHDGTHRDPAHRGALGAPVSGAQPQVSKLAAQLEATPSEAARSEVPRSEATRALTRREAVASGGRRVRWDPSTDSALPQATQATVSVREDAAHPGDSPAFRLRDYSPNSRRGSGSPLASSESDAMSDDLVYRTQGGPGIDTHLPVRDGAMTRRQERIPSLSSAPDRREVDVPPLPSDLQAPEYTMTRRELRALREREDAAARESVGVVPPAPVPPPALIEPARSGYRATPRVEPAPVAQRSAPVVEPEVIEAELVPLPEAELVPVSEPELEPKSEHVPRAAARADVHTDTTKRPAEAESPRIPIPASDVPFSPYGHWSTQAQLDDASQAGDATLSRGVTTGAVTTHALVLPSVPETGEHLLGAFAHTGEVLVTGSVDLPRTFGSTGAHPARFDHPDVDALIDDSDREDASSDSAPVRAVRAISSNTSSRGVIEAPGPRKSRIPMIAAIGVGVLAIIAATVVAAGFIFRVY